MGITKSTRSYPIYIRIDMLRFSQTKIDHLDFSKELTETKNCPTIKKIEFLWGFQICKKTSWSKRPLRHDKSGFLKLDFGPYSGDLQNDIKSYTQDS